MIVNLIIGLPGSGKTWLANKIGGYIVDDITSVDQLPLKTDKDWVITDVNFCSSCTLAGASELIRSYAQMRSPSGTEIEIVKHYFKNEPKACYANVILRSDGRNVGPTIERFTKLYNPPEDAMPVYQQYYKPPLDEINLTETEKLRGFWD